MKADRLPRLTVVSRGERRVITVEPGFSVRDALDTTDLNVRSGCNGSGACGLCRVRIEEGNAGEPAGNELIMLTGEELRDGIRLACRVMPAGDLLIRIVNPAPKSDWRRLIVGGLPGSGLPTRPHKERVPGDGKESYGVALDLGTTNIRMSLWDLKRKRRLSAVLGPNRQSCRGSDVMTRLISACASPAQAFEMSRMVRDSIEEGIMDMCSREGYDFRKIERISVVGNTAMLTLLAEKNAGLLLLPEYWTSAFDCRLEDGQRWLKGCRMNADLLLEIVQPLGGFVGSDLLADTVATGLTGDKETGLLIDFGTNSEIALWDGHKLWVTSAPGGPAFEGWGIRYGMPAEPGAIYRVDGVEGDSTPVVHVMGGGEARGICGSGMVDLIAGLVRAGHLSKKGKLAEGLQDKGFVVARGLPDIVLNNRDVDVFQRAKAAVGAGVRVLLKLAGIDACGLQRICVAGSFGRFLDVRNAQAIGLLPAATSERVELWGSAALMGCESLLLSASMRDCLESLKREKTTLVNLSQAPEFEEHFLESLYLQPLRQD
jgi:uncharacterized 2Fe-2S/4Fe-4S cluster protein (DUF4445 family)